MSAVPWSDGASEPRDLRLAGFALGAWSVAGAVLGASASAAYVVATVAGSMTVLLLVAACRPPSVHRRSLSRTRAWTGRTAVRTAGAAAALGVALGAVSTGAHLSVRDGGPLPPLAAAGTTVDLELVVTDDPRPSRSTSAVVRGTVLVPARLVAVIPPAGAAERVVAGGRVLVLASDPGWRPLLPGQRLLATGRLGPPRGGDLTSAVLFARDGPRVPTRPPWHQRMAGDLRAGLREACAGLPPAEGGLLPGLVVGDTSRMDPEVQDAFVVVGMTHLTAVSGSNVAIVVGAVLLLTRLVRAGPVPAAVLAGVALVGFVVLVRPSPSVLRAAVMGGLALVALAAGRPRAALPALCATVGLLVVVDPALARSPGFALSVLATGALLLLAPSWADRLHGWGVPRPLAEALAVPAAAQTACAPVVAALSGAVSTVAVPANLLAAPAVAPATVLGVLTALLSTVSPWCATRTATVGGWFAGWLVAVAREGAAVPLGTVPWPDGTPGGLLLGALTVLVLAAGRSARFRRFALVGGLAVAAVIVPVTLVAPGWPPPGWLVVACDVGQGDAIVLRAGPAEAVVVDAGPDPGAVDRCLDRLGVAAVPLLLVSHAHADHVGGLPGALRRNVGALGRSAFPDPGRGGADVPDVPEQAGALTTLTLTAGETYQAGAVRLDVLGPARRLAGTRSDPNNNSLVVRAAVGGISVLLPGDLEIEGQRALLSAGVPLRADVLKVPHHGSAYSDPAFLDAVGPRVALVPVGAGNDYGHPDPGVLGHLDRLGARVLRTDLDGDVAVVRTPTGPAVVVAGPDPTRRSP